MKKLEKIYIEAVGKENDEIVSVLFEITDKLNEIIDKLNHVKEV